MPAKKIAPKKKTGPKKEGPSLSDFIRTMPDAKAAEVVEAGKAKGLDISTGLVYAVRSAGKNKGEAKPKGKPGRPKGSASKKAATGGSDIQTLAVRMIIEAVEAKLQELKDSVGL
ncbi:MAG TPA: hypothetical protein VF331_20995 [Polyangiales bacterium]